jgi:hypothetical protein
LKEENILFLFELFIIFLLYYDVIMAIVEKLALGGAEFYQPYVLAIPVINPTNSSGSIITFTEAMRVEK